MLFTDSKWFDPPWGWYLINLATLVFTTLDLCKHPTFDFMFLSCHVRVSEWIHTHSCLNVKELLARSRRKIWSLSDFNRTRPHNHLVHTLSSSNFCLSDRSWTRLHNYLIHTLKSFNFFLVTYLKCFGTSQLEL